MIQPGQKLAANFLLNVVTDGVVRETAFKDLLTRPTVVSVYMKNNTGSCDKQNDALVTAAPALAKAGYKLVALSRDSASSHLKYAAKKKIPYTLASDPDDLFSKAADSVVEKSMYGKKYFGPARAAFVLAEDGTVLAVADKVDTADHAAQLQALIAGLK